jgi:hypothetical protein
MRRAKQAQVAMEYMIIFSIAFLMALPLIVIFASQTNNLQSDIASAQLDKAATHIIDAVEEVYYMGQPAQKTIRITFPSGIQSIDITSYGLVFNMRSSTRDYQYVKETPVNLSGSLQTFEGVHIIVVQAREHDVLLIDT